MKTVVLITTGQPSINPRIVKEADALSNAGYGVTVLYCFWIQWAHDADKILLNKVKWNYKVIGGSPSQNKVLYFLTRARFKISRKLNEMFGNNFLLAERSQARCYDELLSATKSIKADWYIGHNLGTLPIAVKAAANNRTSAGFDFEDYHRGENSNTQQSEIRKVLYLEEKYLPKLAYISAASPLITKEIKRDFPSFLRPVITLLNCFSLVNQPVFKNKSTTDKTLQLFWFSQTVGKNRGLEVVIDAVRILNDDTISITLVGGFTTEIEKGFKQRAGSMAYNLHFMGVVNPTEIMNIAASADVGLALEEIQPLNRDICLTNKIFTYLLAGNAVILSETSMQKAFNSENNVGRSFKVNDVKGVAEAIKFYQNRDSLNSQRQYNYQLAQKAYNWENESKKLLQIIS